MAGTRRSHNKSKNGCNRCRARHIRCDETLPECGGCRKQNHRCDFLAGPPLALLGQRNIRMLLPLPQKTRSVGDRKTVLQEKTELNDENPCSASLRTLNVINSFQWFGDGNSDPFNSMPIRLDARTNAILSFGRDVYNPAMLPIYLPARQLTKKEARVQATDCNWQGIVHRMQSEGSAHGVICFYATVMSVVTGCSTWSRMALSLQVKCMSYLRTRLLQAEISQYSDIIIQVVSLCASENITGRMSAAKAHCNFLSILFGICADHGLVDALSLRVTLDFDRNLSARFLIRTSFDVEVWVPRIITSLFEEALQPFAHLSERPNQPLDLSIQAGPMMRIISDLRDHYHTVRLTSQIRSQTEPWTGLTMYLTMRHTCLEGRLVNHYVDMIESHNQSSDLWPQYYICLAALFMRHTLMHIAIINGVPLNDEISNIRKHLQKAIRKAEETTDLACKRKYNNALLWALFVSVSAERLSNTNTHLDKYWFESRFRSQLLRMGLKKWADVQMIILGFPCVPEVLSQDVSWVEQHMRTCYNEGGEIHNGNISFQAFYNQSGVQK